MNNEYENNEIKNIFWDTGAIKEGHFLLTSGRHSQYYVQCAKIQQYPHYMEIMVKYLADKLSGEYDLVVGPAMGGILLAYELARNYKLPAIFSERDRGKMVFRRDFQVNPSQRVLVAEDVITTGGSVKEVIELIHSSGAQVVDVASLVDRSAGEADFSKYGAEFTSLIKMNIESYPSESCPLCKQGSTPVKPGSR